MSPQTSQGAYNASSKARESKMPGSSSVRPIFFRSLKAARNEIDKYPGLA